MNTQNNDMFKNKEEIISMLKVVRKGNVDKGNIKITESSFEDSNAKEILEIIDNNKYNVETKSISIVDDVTDNDENLKDGYFTVLKNGNITIANYLNYLDLSNDQYKALNYTEKDYQIISGKIKNFSVGSITSVPMICKGHKCNFASSCPYIDIGKEPIGLQCKLENDLIIYWTKKFIEEFEVNPKNFTEIQLVSELAEFNIYEMRITKYIAEQYPTLLQNVVTGIDNAGNVIENEEIAKAYELKERIKSKRMKVLEALLATRKDKVLTINNADRITNSTSEQISQLREKLDYYMNEIASVSKGVD